MAPDRFGTEGGVPSVRGDLGGVIVLDLFVVRSALAGNTAVGCPGYVEILSHVRRQVVGDHSHLLIQLGAGPQQLESEGLKDPVGDTFSHSGDGKVGPHFRNVTESQVPALGFGVLLLLLVLEAVQVHPRELTAAGALQGLQETVGSLAAAAHLDLLDLGLQGPL